MLDEGWGWGWGVQSHLMPKTQWLSADIRAHTRARAYTQFQVHHRLFFSLCSDNRANLSVCLSVRWPFLPPRLRSVNQMSQRIYHHADSKLEYCPNVWIHPMTAVARSSPKKLFYNPNKENTATSLRKERERWFALSGIYMNTRIQRWSLLFISVYFML